MSPETKAPTYDELMWPALTAMKALGGSATHDELVEKVVELEHISSYIGEDEQAHLIGVFGNDSALDTSRLISRKWVTPRPAINEWCKTQSCATRSLLCRLAGGISRSGSP